MPAGRRRSGIRGEHRCLDIRGTGLKRAFKSGFEPERFGQRQQIAVAEQVGMNGNERICTWLLGTQRVVQLAVDMPAFKLDVDAPPAVVVVDTFERILDCTRSRRRFYVQHQLTGGGLGHPVERTFDDGPVVFGFG